MWILAKNGQKILLILVKIASVVTFWCQGFVEKAGILSSFFCRLWLGLVDDVCEIVN